RRDARRRGKAAVTLGGRHTAVLADELLRDAVELPRRDPGLELLADERDRLGNELACARHALDLLLRLANDHRLFLPGEPPGSPEPPPPVRFADGRLRRLRTITRAPVPARPESPRRPR